MLATASDAPKSLVLIFIFVLRVTALVAIRCRHPVETAITVAKQGLRICTQDHRRNESE